MRDTNPFDKVRKEVIDYWDAEGETFERICKVIFDISSYTSHVEIAETADCSRNSVKKHLNRLAELKVVEKDSRTELARYRRNSAYIEWRALRHIIDEYSMEEIIERVEELEARQKKIIERVEELEAREDETIELVDDIEHPNEEEAEKSGHVPSIVRTKDVNLYDSVGTRMEATNEVTRIKRRIRLYELARQALNNDGHLVSREF